MEKFVLLVSANAFNFSANPVPRFSLGSGRLPPARGGGPGWGSKPKFSAEKISSEDGFIAFQVRGITEGKGTACRISTNLGGAGVGARSDDSKGRAKWKT